MQKLILPIDECVLNAAYKQPFYKKRWGFPHYGVDLTAGAAPVSRDGRNSGRNYVSSNRTVRGCGDGYVHSCGLDGSSRKQGMGYAVVVVYKDVLLPNGKRTDLACRMCHFDRLSVRAGQQVTTRTVIGQYGSTGRYVDGAHLHIEFDTDIQWPAYAYGISTSGRVIKRGTLDSTINPCKVWYIGGGQQFTTYPGWMKTGWCDQADLNLPRLP